MNSPIVTFTPAALAQLERLKKSLSVGPDQYIRVGVKGGGCGTTAFMLAFDHRNEKDEEYDVQGIKILVTRGQSMYILGMTIDYVEEEESRGFVFLS